MEEMKRIIILIILVFGTLIGSAQPKLLTGNIYDYVTKEPMVGVNVYLPELRSGAITDGNGWYSLKLSSNKSIKVKFSYIGYKTILKEVTPDSFNYTLNIELNPVSLESEEVVVSGISPSTQHENAIKIETIKAQEIETYGSPNLIEALSSIPGINMISQSPGVSMPVIRGLSMTNIIVMNNGVKLENYQYSKSHAFIIDEFGLEQVEVIKGPTSLLYGSGAVGGVINFIKENPALTDDIVGDYTGHFHSNTLGFCNSLGVKGKKEELLFLHDPYLKLGIDIEGKQKKPSLFENETNGFILINIGLGAKVEFGEQQVDLGVFINNLFNKTYYNHLLSLRELGFYNMGRNISFLIKLPFKI